MADKDQKTHDPSAKRIEDARRKGDVASAPEMRHVAAFAGLIVALGSIGLHATAKLGTALVRLWASAEDFRLDPVGAQAVAGALLGQIAAAVAPLFAALAAFAVLGGLLQGRPTIVWSRIAPKWSKTSPLAGAKRLFGARAFVEFAKTLAKLAIVVGVAIRVLWPHAIALDTLVGADASAIAKAAGGLVATLVKTVALPVVAIAAADFIYQRRSWLAKMRMSLQELKDEHKDSEGDPKIKAKIRQIAMQRARRRMMAAVPDASVVITNPTHYAVALKYDHGRMGAPVVVAKGVDAVALRIREIATAAGVPIVENRPLARALHATVDIDRSIPTEHFAAVAEIISYVLRLAAKGPPRTSDAQTRTS